MKKLSQIFSEFNADDVYKNKIEPAIDVAEKIINRNNEYVENLYLLIVTVPYIVLFFCIPILKESFVALCFLIVAIFSSLIVIGIVVRFTISLDSELRKIYKSQIIFPFLMVKYSRFVYRPKNYFGKRSIGKSLLVSNIIDRVEGEDFFRFYIDDIMMQFSEISVYSKAGLSAGYNQLISGLFLSVDFHKTFTTKCVVRREDNSPSSKNDIYKPTPLLGMEEVILKKIDLESSEFEDEFIVYGDDEIGARVLLSPSMMQRFVDYRKKIGYPIEFSFVDNRLYMHIDSTRNLFDPNIKSIHKFRQGLMNDLTLINDLVSIIQDLNLEVKIWKA